MKACTKCGATMTAQSANKFVCEFCGNVVQIEQDTPRRDDSFQRQSERDRQTEPQKQIVYVHPEQKSSGGVWIVVGILIAIVLVIIIMAML